METAVLWTRKKGFRLVRFDLIIYLLFSFSFSPVISHSFNRPRLSDLIRNFPISFSVEFRTAKPRIMAVHGGGNDRVSSGCCGEMTLSEVYGDDDESSISPEPTVSSDTKEENCRLLGPITSPIIPLRFTPYNNIPFLEIWPGLGPAVQAGQVQRPAHFHTVLYMTAGATGGPCAMERRQTRARPIRPKPRPLFIPHRRPRSCCAPPMEGRTRGARWQC